MKNMDMGQHFSAQSSYMLSGARMIKDEGNKLVQQQKYPEAATRCAQRQKPVCPAGFVVYV